MTKTTNKPPFAVLFDLDGVLIDSHGASLHAQTVTGTKHGFTKEEIQASNKRGGSLKDFYLNLQKLRSFEVDFDTFADAHLEANFAYLKKLATETNHAAAKFIENLREHNIPVALGTSALERSAKRKLAMVGLHDHFEIMVTSNDVERHKPHPDVYLEAAKRVGVPPKRCIVIEDAEAGIQSGKAAGMKVIGLSKYVDDTTSLKQADMVVADFPELSYRKLLKLVKQ